jgi:hypothetical protein
MSIAKTIDTTGACEEILREEWQYNKDNRIWPSQNRVIDRLLDRRVELGDAYAEIHQKLNAHPHAIEELFRALTYTGASWNPGKNVEARAARDRLAEINRDIADKAEALAELLEERSALENTSSFSAHNFYHIGDVIEAASVGNYLFEQYLRERLHTLRGRFDLKYWPSLGACCGAIAQDALMNDPEATNPITEAATRASRASKADFFKALFVAIDEYGAQGHGFIPTGFRLTDETIASLGNCILDLPADNGVDGAYVKRLRQRRRNSGEARSIRPA